MSSILCMQTTTTTTEPKQRLSATAYGEIYRRIMTLEFEPGQRLEEKPLMAVLGIGRTPIREALMHLSDDFMVESHPKAGVIVRPITIQNTRATFAALKVLESGVAGLAVRQEIITLLPELELAHVAVKAAVKQMDIIELVDANSQFHHAFAKCSRNEYLINCLHKVRCETNRLAYLSYGHEVDPDRSMQSHYRSVIQEHSTIIDTLRKREENRLKKTIHQHINTFQKRIIRYMAF